MKIRRYSANDRQACWDLHVAALEDTGALIPGPWDKDFDDIEGSYIRPGGDFFVGELDGAIVAIGALRRVDETTAEVKRMRRKDHDRSTSPPTARQRGTA